MCEDKVRMAAYTDALALIANGKVLLDFGSGSGVLCFAATDNGALKVYGIERADIFKSCKREIKKRELTAKIKIMNCKVEEAPLEGTNIDILVSEWMGYFLLFERMLPSVIYAKKNFLAPAGIMIPAHARIFIAAIEGD
jgi:predicted RNA methylase